MKKHYVSYVFIIILLISAIFYNPIITKSETASAQLKIRKKSIYSLQTGISNNIITSQRYKIITPTIIRTLPDGGKDYVYIINGHENIFHETPKGFNALTASNDELKLYNIESRPTDPEQLKLWVKKWGNFKIPDAPRNLKIYY